MIEVLPDMPRGVTGIRVSGRLRGDDLREVKPVMQELVQAGELAVFGLDELDQAKEWAAG